MLWMLERSRDVSRASWTAGGTEDRMEDLCCEEKAGPLSVLLYILATFYPPFSHQRTTVLHTRSNSFVRVMEVSVGTSFGGSCSPRSQ